MNALLSEPGIGTLTWRSMPGSMTQARALAAVARVDEVQAGGKLEMTAGGLRCPISTIRALVERGLLRPGIVEGGWCITPLGKLALAWLDAVDIVGSSLPV